MTWLSGISSEEKTEIFQDLAAAFKADSISESEFRLALGKLGYNATDIVEYISFYRPEPPENADGDAD